MSVNKLIKCSFYILWLNSINPFLRSLAENVIKKHDKETYVIVINAYTHSILTAVSLSVLTTIVVSSVRILVLPQDSWYFSTPSSRNNCKKSCDWLAEYMIVPLLDVVLKVRNNSLLSC